MKRIALLCNLALLLFVFAPGCGGDDGEGNVNETSGSETAESTEDGAAEGTEGGTTPEEDAGGTGEADGEGSEEGTEGGDTCSCTTPDDCEAGQLCVAAGAGSGVCSDYPPAGLCWDDSQCPFGATCQNAVVCPCDVECLQHTPGTCTQGSGCCEDDSDCIGGDVCANNVCKGLVGNKCWRDADCGAGLECVGEVICPCGSECVAPDTMGTCFEAGLNCCVSDLDCAFGSSCLGEVCVEDAGEMGCWSDADCASGEACSGAVPPCGCTLSCAESASMGMCQGPLACCSATEECADGEECIGGACREPMPLPGPTGCWQDADCEEENAICEGAVLCSCGSLCQQLEAAGTCAVPIEPNPDPEPQKCCEEDAECGEEVCVLGACKPAPEKGSCWTDQDCKEAGGLCIGAKVCPCEAPCATDPDAAEEKQGKCEEGIGLP